MSEVISSFRSLRAGSQVFALLIVISLSDFAYYVFGQEPAVAVHLALWYVCLSAIIMMFVKILLAVCMLVGIVGLSESGLCVFCKLCPV